MSPIEIDGRLPGGSLIRGERAGRLIEEAARRVSLIGGIVTEKKAGRWWRESNSSKPVDICLPADLVACSFPPINKVSMAPNLIRDTRIYSTADARCCQLIDVAPWTDLTTVGGEEYPYWSQTEALLGVGPMRFDRETRRMSWKAQGQNVVLDTGPKGWRLAVEVEGYYLFAQELRRAIAALWVFDSGSIAEIGQRGMVWVDPNASSHTAKAVVLPVEGIVRQLPESQTMLQSVDGVSSDRLLVLPVSLPLGGLPIKERQLLQAIYQGFFGRKFDPFVFVDR